MLRIKPTSAEYKKIQREILAKVNACVSLIENTELHPRVYLTQGLYNLPLTKNKKNLELYQLFMEKSLELLSQTTETIIIAVPEEIIDYLFKNFGKQFIYQFLDSIHAKCNKHIAIRVPNVLLTEILTYLDFYETYGTVPRVNSWFCNRVLKDAKLLLNNYSYLYSLRGIEFKHITDLTNFRPFDCHFCKRRRTHYDNTRCIHAKCVHHPGVYQNYRWTCCWKTDHVRKVDYSDPDEPQRYKLYRPEALGCTRSPCRPERLLE
jgi:hypothetical protein